jgi:hypothetical protein
MKKTKKNCFFYNTWHIDSKKTPFSKHVLFIHILPSTFSRPSLLKYNILLPPHSYEEFMSHYNIRLNFIEYFSILSAIPHRWKLLIRGIGKLDLIENDIVDRLKRDP